MAAVPEAASAVLSQMPLALASALDRNWHNLAAVTLRPSKLLLDAVHRSGQDARHLPKHYLAVVTFAHQLFCAGDS